MSERGDSNARPLRPERSALPTALLSVLRLQSYIIFFGNRDINLEKSFKNFGQSKKRS